MAPVPRVVPGKNLSASQLPQPVIFKELRVTQLSVLFEIVDISLVNDVSVKGGNHWCVWLLSDR